MHIAGEVQVDVFHRQHLGVAAACRAAFDAEDRAERWLANRRDCFLAKLVEALCQPDSDRRFAFARRGWGNGRNHNQFPARPR